LGRMGMCALLKYRKVRYLDWLIWMVGKRVVVWWLASSIGHRNSSPSYAGFEYVIINGSFLFSAFRFLLQRVLSKLMLRPFVDANVRTRRLVGWVVPVRARTAVCTGGAGTPGGVVEC
jgi:hypothetical protein